MSDSIKDKKQALVPRLRFPEFREVWCSSPMSERYSFRGNNSLSRDKLNYSEGSLRNIHYGDIHTKFALHFRVDAELVPYINDGESHSAIRPENYCMPGDVVFADASEDMEDIGKAIEVIDTGDVPLVCGLHTILARLDTADFALGFGAYLFSSEGTRKQIQREAQGAKVLGLSASRLGNVKLHYPRSTREQQKITDCLSSLDALIAAQADKLDALKTHKRGLMQQLFPREGEIIPRLRFPEFREAGEWEQTNLEQLVDFRSGGTPSKANPAFWSGSIPWVSAKDMKQLFLDDTEDHISTVAVDDGAKMASPGTLLMLTRGMTLLKDVPICVLQRGMSFNQDVKALRPKKDMDGLFLAFSLLANLHRLLKMVDIAGHGTGKLNTDELKLFELVRPQSDEQQKIADCFSSIDALIAAQADKLDALKIHKKGLMQQLFPSPEA